MPAKPGGIQIVAILWIVDGILTILWAFGLVVAAVASLVGILCLPLALYPFGVGIVELVYGIKLSSSTVSVAKPPIFVSVLSAALAPES